VVSLFVGAAFIYAKLILNIISYQLKFIHSYLFGRAIARPQIMQ